MGNQKESNISPDEYLDLFEKAIKKLAMAVDKEMGEGRYLIYFEKLHPYSIEEIQAAVDQAIHDEQFNVIPPVGKLIRYIEDAREERKEHWPRLEFKEEWPTVTPERVRELVQPFYDKLEKQKREINGEGRENRWKENKEKLQKQVSLVKRNAGPVEQT